MEELYWVRIVCVPKCPCGCGGDLPPQITVYFDQDREWVDWALGMAALDNQTEPPLRKVIVTSMPARNLGRPVYREAEGEAGQ